MPKAGMKLSALSLLVALCGFCVASALSADSANEAETCAVVDDAPPGMEVVFLQRAHAVGSIGSLASCDQVYCPSGISTSCSNGMCTVSCGGTVKCQDLHCPDGMSSSCTNGQCTIDCKGSTQTEWGQCEKYYCPSGISNSCTNGYCTLKCGGTTFCQKYCNSISTSCSNGDCTITCAGGSSSNSNSNSNNNNNNNNNNNANSGSGCTTGDCAVYSDPHVAGFDSFRNHEVPAHLMLLEADACAEDVMPIDVNLYKTGIFWLARNSLLQVQGRFVLSGEFVPDHAAVGEVAVGGPLLDGKKLVVGAGDVASIDGFRLMNGQQLVFNLTRGLARIKSHKGQVLSDGKPTNRVEATFPDGVRLLIVQLPKYVDTKITIPKKFAVDGVCGNMNGKTADDTEEEVSKRMGGLTVGPGESLFGA